MDIKQLNEICDLVGGKPRLAEMIGVNNLTIYRKLNGTTKIKGGDVLKVRQALTQHIDDLKEAVRKTFPSPE
jgi:hypothetical protein